jgi:hypothetical protein
MVAVIIFTIGVINNEKNYNLKAFSEIVREKKQYFDEVYKVAPLFKIEDQLMTSLTQLKHIEEVQQLIEQIPENAFVDYEDVINGILNTDYTFVKFNLDSIDVIANFSHYINTSTDSQETIDANNIRLTTHNSFISFCKPEDLGNGVLMIYKHNGLYWVFATFDNNTITEQTKDLTILFAFILSFTFLLNCVMIFIINKYRKYKKLYDNTTKQQ